MPACSCVLRVAPLLVTSCWCDEPPDEVRGILVSPCDVTSGVWALLPLCEITRGVLVVDLSVSRPDNWIRPHQTAVTPTLVREIVEQALAEGWEPDDPGPFPFQYALTVDRV